MAWKVDPVNEQRFAACHAVRTLHRPVADVARQWAVSRKTLHKWLERFDALGGAAGASSAALADRSRRPARRPARSPARTGDAVERRIVEVRDAYHWGPRKIHAFLAARGEPCCARRTVADVLRRHGRVAPPAVGDPPPVRRFERPGPNQLWQVDHKGPVEVDRRKVPPLSVTDDCSRWCLAFEPVPDKTMAAAWAVLWRVFDEAGLPDEILTDNAFGVMGPEHPVGLSSFDARLVRLGIRPTHGRPYHPQTQGKVERFHGSAVRELIEFNARRDSLDHFAEDCRRWRDLYNTLRPHEALGDRPPASVRAPSPRKRPAALPEPESFYGPGAELRKVCVEGLVRVDGHRLLVGRGIGGQLVRVERRERELAVFYCAKQVRRLSHDQLSKDRVL